MVSILKKQDAGIPTADICREIGISQATFYNWRAKYLGNSSVDLIELREDNERLKRMYAQLSLKYMKLKSQLKKGRISLNLIKAEMIIKYQTADSTKFT
jgi:putative transposase